MVCKQYLLSIFYYVSLLRWSEQDRQVPWPKAIYILVTEYRTRKSQILSKLKFIVILKAPKGFCFVKRTFSKKTNKGETQLQEDSALLIDGRGKTELLNCPILLQSLTPLIKNFQLGRVGQI